MSHTPGPWVLTNEPYEDGTPYYIIKAGQGLWGEEPGDGFTLREIMCAADAHLIAAAPEMLEILQRISVSYPGYIPDFVEAVVAVINKATGATTPSVPSPESK